MTRGHDYRSGPNWDGVPPLPDPKQPRYDGIEGLGGGEDAFGAPRTGLDDQLGSSSYLERPREEQEVYDNVERGLAEAGVAGQPDTKRRRTFGEWVGDNKAFTAVAGAVGTLALTLTAATVLAKGPNNSAENNPGTSTEPVATAPANPDQTGAGETTTNRVELTADTVEFRVGDKEVVGIDEFYKQNGVFRENNPDAPAPSKDEGSKIWTDFLGALQTGINVETDPGTEQLKKEATDKLLFVKGSSGALREFVFDLQSKGAKVVGMEEVGLITKPEKAYVATGQVTMSIQYTDGKIKKYYVTATTTNDFGVIHNIDHVSTVREILPK